jgi:hypothetical protein
LNFSGWAIECMIIWSSLDWTDRRHNSLGAL